MKLARLWPTYFLLLLLIWFQVQLWAGRGNLPTVWQLRSDLQERKDRNSKLEVEIAQLEAQIQDLKTGMGIVEERARSELLMLKPNEIFVQTQN